LQHLQALLALKARLSNVEGHGTGGPAQIGSMPNSRSPSATEGRRSAGGGGGSRGSGGGASLSADYKSSSYEGVYPAHAEYSQNNARDAKGGGANYMSFESEYD
jgi:hypothetical protein